MTSVGVKINIGVNDRRTISIFLYPTRYHGGIMLEMKSPSTRVRLPLTMQINLHFNQGCFLNISRV